MFLLELAWLGGGWHFDQSQGLPLEGTWLRHFRSLCSCTAEWQMSLIAAVIKPSRLSEVHVSVLKEALLAGADITPKCQLP